MVLPFVWLINIFKGHLHLPLTIHTSKSVPGILPGPKLSMSNSKDNCGKETIETLVTKVMVLTLVPYNERLGQI